MKLIKDIQGKMLSGDQFRPELLRFRNQSSMDTCLAVLNQWPGHQHAVARPLVVITGPPGCGKTVLCESLIQTIYGVRHDHVKTVTGITGERDIGKAIDYAMLSSQDGERPQYLILDMMDAVGTKMFQSVTLEQITQATMWSCRKAKRGGDVNLRCKLQVFITVNRINLSRDLERRCRRIELVENDHILSINRALAAA